MTNHERNLLASVLKSRDAYQQIADFIGPELSEQGRTVLAAAEDYYGRDAGAPGVDQEILKRETGRGLTNPKHLEAFNRFIDTLYDHETSPANVVHDFISARRDSIGAQIATALAAGKEPKDVLNLMDQYQEWSAKEALDEVEEEQHLTLKTVLPEDGEEEQLIQLIPNNLNRRLAGGLKRGHHALVFARPEMGKTMLVLTFIAGFLQQGLRTLYVGNEEPIKDTRLRMYSRLLKAPVPEIERDKLGYMEQIPDEYTDLLHMFSLSPGTPRRIEDLCDELKPDVVIIDQLRNLYMREDNFVQKLEKAATAARYIAKRKNALVISVTQAGDSAEGRAVLEMGDVDSSNTGIPAQVDVMIGMGATRDDVFSGRRTLTLCKNKRSGVHDFFPVKVEPEHSIVSSLD